MEIVFYHTKSDNDVYPKTLQELGTENGTIIYDMGSDMPDIINPVITVSRANIANVALVNYCKITAFDRYYFCYPEFVQDGIIRIHCHVDLLQTCGNKLKKEKALVVKTASPKIFNLNRFDDTYKTMQQPIYDVVRFDGDRISPELNSYVLVCAGH